MNARRPRLPRHACEKIRSGILPGTPCKRVNISFSKQKIVSWCGKLADFKVPNKIQPQEQSRGGVPDGLPHIIFVAHVYFDGDGRLKVNANRFSNDNVWNAENRHRIVVPKLLFLSLLRGESFAKG